MGSHKSQLQPGSSDFPAFTPAEAGTRYSDPGRMQGWVDLGLIQEVYFVSIGRRKHKHVEQSAWLAARIIIIETIQETFENLFI